MSPRFLLYHDRLVSTYSSSDGTTPLHVAARAWRTGDANVGVVSYIAGMMGGLGSADAADDEGRTPLHLAAERGHVEIARVLIGMCRHTGELWGDLLSLTSRPLSC